MQEVLSELNTQCRAAIDHLHLEYSKLQTGRATAALVEDIMVESYGAKMPLKALATISVPEPKQIAIQPWNRDQLVNVEKAIRDSDLGLNPVNDGAFVRLMIPPMTEERRKDLVKRVHKLAEESRISVRNARHEAIGSFKAMEKGKLISEDDLRHKEKQVQETVDAINGEIEETAKHKEQDILTV